MDQPVLPAALASTSPLERQDIEDRYKWNLTSIFADWNAWQTAYEELDRQIDASVRENAAIRATPDFREGITSFLEKRKPRWTDA